MRETESEAQNPSENDGTGQDNTNKNRKKPTKYSIQVGEVSIEAESHDTELSEMSRVCMSDTTTLLEYRLRGQMQVIEEEDLHSMILGD